VKWLLFFGKKYATPLLSALLVAGVIGIWLHGYQMGKTVQEAAHSDAMDELREQAATLADELETVQSQRRIEYQDRVRTVYVEPDSSGCANVAIPVGVRDALGGSSD